MEVEFDVRFSGQLAKEFLAVLNTAIITGHIYGTCPELREVFLEIHRNHPEFFGDFCSKEWNKIEDAIKNRLE